MKDTIIVLGGDGYFGWPLSLRLAKQFPKSRILIVDNYLRRELVSQVGGESLLPIQKMEARIKSFENIHAQSNLHFLHFDVSRDNLDSLLAKEHPHTIYHLAQQCSAPFSMRGEKESLLTIQNNEIGNMKLLWAVRNQVPEAHIIKLGSFGEYAKFGLDIAEGYFWPESGGKKASQPAPYPRQSDDIYHASKINDTNYISIACRKWGLKVTDIMQSTIFGTWTPEIGENSELFTRFDYDECFGTVVNRFLVQMMLEHPLTVYGTGHQRTGLMALNDSVRSLASLVNHIPGNGTHKVINNVTESGYSVLEIAEVIRDLGRKLNFKTTIQKGSYNPRGEEDCHKATYVVETRFVSENLITTPMPEVLTRTLKMLHPFLENINPVFFRPKTQWATEVTRNKTPDKISITSTTNTNYWNLFREEQFSSSRINLNPGTFGTPSCRVQWAQQAFYSEEYQAYPLGRYKKGRDYIQKIRSQAGNIWPSAYHTLHITQGASQTSNLLALSIAQAYPAKEPISVLTTEHEHPGGIGAFEKMKCFRVHKLSYKQLKTVSHFAEAVKKISPKIVMISSLTYDSGELLPVGQLSKVCKQLNPEILFCVDAAQSLGIIPLTLSKHVDFVFSSCHKWLFGPAGTGLAWSSGYFREKIQGLHFSGEELDTGKGQSGFALSGGIDFAQLSGLEAALNLYTSQKPEVIHQRSIMLRDYFVSMFNEKQYAWKDQLIIEKGQSGVSCCIHFLKLDPYPVYDELNKSGIHCKCIKKSGTSFLRFGFPYYESKNRIKYAAAKVFNLFEQINLTRSTNSIKEQKSVA